MAVLPKTIETSGWIGGGGTGAASAPARKRKGQMPKVPKKKY